MSLGCLIEWGPKNGMKRVRCWKEKLKWEKDLILRSIKLLKKEEKKNNIQTKKKNIKRTKTQNNCKSNPKRYQSKEERKEK